MKNWRAAARSLIRRPGFTIAVLALWTPGIGVNTALFSVVNAVRIEPMPFPQPDQLGTLLETTAAKSQKDSLIAPVRLEEWGRLSRTFQSISGSYSENVTGASLSEPERLTGRRVAPHYFDAFATPALIGRTFTAEEDLTSGPLAAVISHGLWMRRYNSDPHITDRRLIVDGKSISNVGVMPKTFSSPA